MHETKCLQYKIKSPVLSLYAVASKKGLCGLYLTEQKNIPSFRNSKELQIEKNSDVDAIKKILFQASDELSEYFEGKRKKFSVPLDLNGTEFQKKVWQAILKIPYGKTCSYKDIAQKIKHPKAVRAVGNANGKNPLCVLVPCHRVIASDGLLGGYSGGLAIKKKLLQLEKSIY